MKKYFTDAERKVARRANAKKFRDANRELCIARTRECQKANPESVRRASKKHKASSEYLRKRRERYAQDPAFRSLITVASCIRASLKAQDTRKSTKTENLLGCSRAAFRAHIEALFWPGMSNRNRNLWRLDHIQPCASFTLSNPAQQAQCFHWTNWQPLWADDNGIKSDRLDWTPHESRHSLPERFKPAPFFLPESAKTGTI